MAVIQSSKHWWMNQSTSSTGKNEQTKLMSLANVQFLFYFLKKKKE